VITSLQDLCINIKSVATTNNAAHYT